MDTQITISALSPSNKPQGSAKNPQVIPVGLNFGPTWVAADFIINENEYYTGAPSGPVYKSFFQDSLRSNVQCNLDNRPSAYHSGSTVSPFTSQNKFTNIVKVFSNAIQSATEMGIAALDYNPALKFKVMAIAVPDHWGNTARGYVATAAQIAGYPLDGSHMILPLSRAVQLSYSLQRCTEGKYFTLLLDFHGSHLHLMLVEMCGTECVMKGQAYFPHLGQDRLPKSSVLAIADSSDKQPSDDLNRIYNWTGELSLSDSNTGAHSDLPTSDVPASHGPDNYSTSDHSPIDESTGDNNDEDSATVPEESISQRTLGHNEAARFKPILDTLSKFMILMTTPEASSPEKEPGSLSHTASDVIHAVKDVRYILVDGEASHPGPPELSNAIKAKFVNETWIDVKQQLDSGAYGATLAAIRQWENPQHVGDWRDLPSSPVSGKTA